MSIFDEIHPSAKTDFDSLVAAMVGLKVSENHTITSSQEAHSHLARLTGKKAVLPSEEEIGATLTEIREELGLR